MSDMKLNSFMDFLRAYKTPMKFLFHFLVFCTLIGTGYYLLVDGISIFGGIFLLIIALIYVITWITKWNEKECSKTEEKK